MDGRGRAAQSFPRPEAGFVPTSNPQTRWCHPLGSSPRWAALREGLVLDQGHLESGPNPHPTKEQGGAGQPRVIAARLGSPGGSSCSEDLPFLGAGES